MQNPEQVGQRRRTAAIGHVLHVDASHLLEEFTEQVIELPLPDDPKVTLPGLTLA
jgi:hypothetical protein